MMHHKPPPCQPIFSAWRWPAVPARVLHRKGRSEAADTGPEVRDTPSRCGNMPYGHDWRPEEYAPGSAVSGLACAPSAVGGPLESAGVPPKGPEAARATGSAPFAFRPDPPTGPPAPEVWLEPTARRPPPAGLTPPPPGRRLTAVPCTLLQPSIKVEGCRSAFET